MFDLMNAGYNVQHNRPIIYLLSRDAHRKRVVHKIEDFRPYFFKPGGSYEDIFGRPIERHFAKLPRDVRTLRKQFEFTCEADILFEWRYLIDKGIKCGYDVIDGTISPAESLDVPPKIGYFDIEVETPPEIMARPKSPIWPIVSLQFSTNYSKEITLFMLNTKIPVEEVEAPKGFHCTGCGTYKFSFLRRWKQKERIINVEPIIYLYDDEKTMINDVTKWVVNQDFDAIGGYNSNLFDWPYWIRRARTLRVDLRVLSPFRFVDCKPTPRGLLKPRVKGVSLIDFYTMYQKWSGGRQGEKRVMQGRSFALTFDFHLVLERECGFFYEDLGDRVAESRRNSPIAWARYCTGDALGLRILDSEKGITKYFDRLRRIVGCPLEWAVHNSRLLDMRLLRLREKPLPTKRYGKKQRVKGAIVLAPKVGIHEHVVIIDEKALYPMLIRVYNLSPETYVSRKEDWKDDDIIVGPMEDGTILHFRKRPEGIFPKAVRYDMEEREKYRSKLRVMKPTNPEYERVKMLETLHKFLACSYYGVTGYENFRLYSDPVRKAITYLGREALLQCKRDCEKAGYKVLYGDTDSLFVQLRTDLPGEGRVIERIVNDTLKRIAWRKGATFNVEAKYERYCKRIIFVPKIEHRKGEITAAKKRYAYIDEDDNLYVVGLAPRRSSTPVLTRKLMLKWLFKILVEKDVSGATKLVREAWDRLPEFPVNEIGLPRGLHETSYKFRNPWLDGCTYMTERYGKVFREDKKPLLIWMKFKRRPTQKNKLFSKKRGLETDVICVTETDEKLPVELLPHVDWRKMRERVIRNHFKPLFDAIGLNFDEEIVKREMKLTKWL